MASAAVAAAEVSRLLPEQLERAASNAAAALRRGATERVHETLTRYALPFERESGVTRTALDILTEVLLRGKAAPYTSPFRDFDTFMRCLGESPIIILAITHAEHTGVQSVFSVRDDPHSCGKGLLGFSRFYDSRESLGAFYLMGAKEYEYVREKVLNPVNCAQFLREVLSNGERNEHSITFRNEPFYVRKLTMSEDEKDPLLKNILGIYQIDFLSKKITSLTSYYEDELYSSDGITEDELLKSIHARSINLYNGRPTFAFFAGCNVLTDKIPGSIIAQMVKTYSGPQGVSSASFAGAAAASSSKPPVAFKGNLDPEAAKKQRDVLSLEQFEAIKEENDKSVGRLLHFATWLMVWSDKSYDVGKRVLAHSLGQDIARAASAGVSDITIMRLLASFFNKPFNYVLALQQFHRDYAEIKKGRNAYNKSSSAARKSGMNWGNTNAGKNAGNNTGSKNVNLARFRAAEASRMRPNQLKALNDRDALEEALRHNSLVDFAALVSARYHRARQAASRNPSTLTKEIEAAELAALTAVFNEQLRQERVAVAAEWTAAASGAGAAAPVYPPAVAAAEPPAAASTSAAPPVLHSPLPVPDISVLHRRVPNLPDWKMMKRSGVGFKSKAESNSRENSLLPSKYYIAAENALKRSITVKKPRIETKVVLPEVRIDNDFRTVPKAVTNPIPKTISKSVFPFPFFIKNGQYPTAPIRGGARKTRKSKNNSRKSKPKRQTRSKH